MRKTFATIVVCDFEYEVADGDLPNVLCMVACVLNEKLEHVRTVRLYGAASSAGSHRSTPDPIRCSSPIRLGRK